MSSLEPSDGTLFREEVFPIPKRVRPWACKWENPTCTRSAPCPRCRGLRSRRKGQRKQNMVRKQFVPDARFHGELANEEHWRAALRLEVKAGRQVSAIATKFLAAEGQSYSSKAMGDLRPFCFVAMPDGWGSEGLAVVRLSVLAALLTSSQPASE